MKQRIWELDVFRGICILGMIVIHLLYDLVELYDLVNWEYPSAFLFVAEYGGILFLLISGICVTLGTRSVKRGVIVFACGLLCTAVTLCMVLLQLVGWDMVIWFGILHCLGLCMLLWPLVKKLPTIVLALLGVLFVIIGNWLCGITPVEFPYLIFLGICPSRFSSPDFFPLLPNFGYFLLGAVLGRTLYRKQTSLFSKCNTSLPIVRFLSACGRYSLPIYLLHQPILSVVCLLLALIQ